MRNTRNNGDYHLPVGSFLQVKVKIVFRLIDQAEFSALNDILILFSPDEGHLHLSDRPLPAAFGL